MKTLHEVASQLDAALVARRSPSQRRPCYGLDRRARPGARVVGEKVMVTPVSGPVRFLTLEEAEGYLVRLSGG